MTKHYKPFESYTPEYQIRLWKEGHPIVPEGWTPEMCVKVPPTDLKKNGERRVKRINVYTVNGERYVCRVYKV